MPEREPDVIDSVKKALPPEPVDLEGNRITFVAPNDRGLEIHCKLVTRLGDRPFHEVGDHLVGEGDREHPVLVAVALEDVCEAGCDDRADTEVREGPRRMLSRRTAPEVPSGKEDRS